MGTTIIRSDSSIQQAVLQELKWDTRVEETDVGVEVDNGIVTLTGTVSSYAKKLAAVEAAHRVVGVRDVANDIVVKVPGMAPTDTDIARAVRHALEWDVMVPHEHIQSTVTNGMVTLRGSVERYSQKEDADRAVRNLAGVQAVINYIEIEYTPRPSAPELQEAIEEALKRRAERTAEHIQVIAKDGVVTLRGHVNSWEERRAVAGLVRHAPGIREVKDELTYG